MQHFFGPTGHLNVRVEVLAGRPNPTTNYTYDSEGNLLSITHPEGNATTYVYDGANASRRSQGNRLSTTLTPGPRGADQSQLVSTFTYEPVFNQLRSKTDPRGNTWTYTFDYEEACDFAAIGAKIGLSPAEAQSLVQGAGLCLGPAAGDLNDDGLTDQANGNLIKAESPTVVLPVASKQANFTGDFTQEVVDLYQYNQFGQLILHRDAEMNIHERDYHPESDPDGDGTIDNAVGDPLTGGYLEFTKRDSTSGANRNSGTDPDPVDAISRFEYNPRGTVIASFDPRGVETRQILNQLDQPVQVLRAASIDPGLIPIPGEPLARTAFAFVTELEYDANDNLVRRDVEDRGDTSNTGGVISTVREYDILDRLLATTEEIDSSTSRTTSYRYDPNGNRVLIVFPEGNAQSHQFDERDLLTATTKGAQNAPAEAQIAVSPTFDPRGGTPSTVHFDYDDNGNRSSVTDAADTDGSVANNGPTGGDRSLIEYDGYDRQIATVDSVGNVVRTHYNANSNVLRIERFGPDGGPTPLANGPSNNLLEETDHHYDVLNRLVQTDRHLFSNTIPANGSEEGATSIGKGNLVPGDGAVNTVYEYDALGRRTFTVHDDEDTSIMLYDGLGRVLLETDPAGNEVEFAYDDNNNVIETQETDVSTKAGVADEIFLTTRLYDSLNRLSTVVDNLGQATRFVYDSRDNLLVTSDANGPVTGTTIVRRVFASPAGTVNTINEHGNVIRHQYDGLNRRTSTTRVLTASGFGDGTLTPSPSPVPGINVDGVIRSTVNYDLNSLIAGRADDWGHRTEFEYDNLNRRVAEHRGVVPGTPGVTTSLSFEYDPDHNLLRKTDEMGTIFNHTHDGINRRIAVGIVPGTGVVGTTSQTFEYDGLGRLTFSSDDNGSALTSAVTCQYDYDSLSRVIRETLTPNPSSTAAQTRINWRAEDLPAELHYPNGRQIDRYFDSLDRVGTVEDTGSAPEIATFDYIGKSRALEVSYPAITTRHTFLNNASTTASGYDGARRPIAARDLDSTNAVITGFAHTYDRTANRVTEQKLHNLANSESYTYDSAYRLLDLNRPAPGSVPLQFSSWEIGGRNNWASVDGNGRAYSNHNELVTYTTPAPVLVQSDDNGNVTGVTGGRTYKWDTFNRLVAVQDGTALIARYFYDAAGRRVRKENTNSGALNGITEYFYDGPHVIEERDGMGTSLRQFVYGGGIDKPLRYDDLANSRSYHYHRNALGSTFALSDIATGDVVERMLYDAYGNVQVTQIGGAPATGNPFLFTGRRLDPATGLCYYRARYLDTVMGRFLSRDPLGIWGDPANIGNSYAYCSNNPINGTDPSGMLEIKQTANYGGLHSMDGATEEFMNGDPRDPIATGIKNSTITGSDFMASPPSSSLVINLSLGWNPSIMGGGSRAGGGGNGLLCGCSHLLMDSSGSSGITIWDYERMFSDVSGLNAQGLFSHADLQRHLAGNDNEWRMFDGADLGLASGFAPLQPAEFLMASGSPTTSGFYEKGNKAAGFYEKGNKAAGIVCSGGTTMFTPESESSDIWVFKFP